VWPGGSQGTVEMAAKLNLGWTGKALSLRGPTPHACPNAFTHMDKKWDMSSCNTVR